MSSDIALSVNGVPIRLTSERWNHVVENHNDMAGYFYDVLETVASPTWVFEGDDDELWAVKLITKTKAFLVIYRESVSLNDGFIITAFTTTKVKKLLKRRIAWQRQQPQ